MTGVKRGFDVIVIGAGVSGLTFAHKAGKAGASVCVLEAGNWIGGRIGLTDNHISTGAEFVHGNSGPIWDLIDEFELPTYSYRGGTGKSRFVDERFCRIDFLAERVTEIVEQVYRSPTDSRTISKFFSDEYSPADEAARFAIERVCRVEGCDPNSCTVQALSEQAARNLDDGVNYRIVGGYAQLIHGLSGGEYKVYLGMPVSVVRHFSTHCEIETLGGEKFSAAAVVIATPLTALRMGAIRFEPALREEIVTSIDALQLGHAMKVIAELNGRLDIPENYVFSHHPIHSIWKNDEGDRSHLIGFVGGQPYVNNVTDLKGGIPNAFRSMALSLFGDIKIEKIYWKTWSETPWIGYSYTHPGKVGSDSMDVLAAPNYKRLFFVGEGTATDGKLGTVSGAISSAFRAFSQYESEFE